MVESSKHDSSKGKPTDSYKHNSSKGKPTELRVPSITPAKVNPLVVESSKHDSSKGKPTDG